MQLPWKPRFASLHKLHIFMKKKWFQRIARLALGLVLAGVLAGCSDSAGGGAESSQDGEALFRQPVIGSSAGCSTCHSVEPGAILIGPSLAGIGAAAGGRVEGLSAEEYLSQSILEPDAYVVDGFPSGVMPARLASDLPEDQLKSLLVYMLSLK